MHGRRFRAASLFLAAALAGCGESSPQPTDEGEAIRPPTRPPVGPPPQPEPSPHLIGLTPSKPRIDAGATVRFTAVAYDDNMQAMPHARISWGSSNIGIADVDSAGVATGVSPGYVMVTASSGSTSAAATLHVMRNGMYPDIVTVEPAVTAVRECDEVQLSAATLPDVDANHFIWRSSNDAVLSVTALGLLRGVAPGSARVTVIWEPDTTRRTSRTVQVTAC